MRIFYEDKELIAVEKPPGMDAQSVHSFAPDMVSEIRKHIHMLSTGGGEPYVGVIHRLDKPVGGIMVYGKTPRASAALSASLQAGEINKRYLAVVCGKPVDNQGAYVDYLLQDRKNNRSDIVDKSVPGSKKGELNYRVRQVIHREVQGQQREYALVEVELLTGRHHQIRAQLSGHGTPLCGDRKYGGEAAPAAPGLALWAFFLSFPHPVTGKRMTFERMPAGGAFAWFGAEPAGQEKLSPDD